MLMVSPVYLWIVPIVVLRIPLYLSIRHQKSGSWNTLESVLGYPEKLISLPVDESISSGKDKWSRISKHIHPFTSLSERGKADLLKTILEFQNFPLTKLNCLDLHVDIKHNYIYIPLKNNDDIVGYKMITKDGEENTFPPNSACGIVTTKRSSKAAVIVHNIKDFLTLLLYNLSENIVCLPHGEQKLPQSILPLLENYDRLVLWLGSNTASWDSARVFARKLQSNRCFLVSPLEEQTSVYAAHLKKKDVLNIISTAPSVSHPSIITFNDIREDIAAELHNADKVSGVKWQRFPTLNTILKGHRRGELTILTGPTGSGKTTFMSEYSLDLAIQKVTTLWGSFEIRNQRLAKTMLQQMVCQPLEKNLTKFDSWADLFEQLPIYFMTFHGQQELTTVMEAVRHATYVHDVSHVIVDNVQFMLGLSSREAGFLDRFSRQDQLIGAFRNFATVYNCHVTLVIHPRKERDDEPLTANSIFGGAKASQEADNVLIIQNKTNQSSLKMKKYLQIAKNRFSGDLGMMSLDFNRNSLSFSNKEE
ncbi:mitochondrial DNA helicase isoform X2 [Rhodnius prolixus]|uniref:mitochondrial DNA helicase isoform X2 n=1 Tax=Rhodnius prolixus TaxID=13249 RepID=UPI003D189BF6